MSIKVVDDHALDAQHADRLPRRLSYGAGATVSGLVVTFMQLSPPTCAFWYTISNYSWVSTHIIEKASC